MHATCVVKLRSSTGYVFVKIKSLFALFIMVFSTRKMNDRNNLWQIDSCGKIGSHLYLLKFKLNANYRDDQTQDQFG